MVHQCPLYYVIFIYCHYKFLQTLFHIPMFIFSMLSIYIHKVQKCLSKVSILSRCVLRCKYRSCRLFPSVLKISFMCHKLVMFNVQCKLERVRPWYGHCILHLSKCLYQHKLLWMFIQLLSIRIILQNILLFEILLNS